LCDLIGLPHVHYDLAVEIDGNQEGLPGVICENMAIPPKSLALGNQLLLSLDPSYPSDQRFRVQQHTIDAVTNVLVHLQPIAEKWGQSQPDEVDSAYGSFVGFVLLDAWIANQDRHHENWGALVDTVYSLAPTFDHGAALARNITDEERKVRLSTNDRGRSVAAFVKRARSAFYASESQEKPLSTLDAFQAFASKFQIAADAWLDRVLAVSRDQICGILEKLPEKRISEVGRDFTLAVLLENQRRLKESISQ